MTINQERVQYYNDSLMKIINDQHIFHQECEAELDVSMTALFVLAEEIFDITSTDVESDYTLLSQVIRALRYLNREYTGMDHDLLDMDSLTDRLFLNTVLNFTWFNDPDIIDMDLRILEPCYTGSPYLGRFFDKPEEYIGLTMELPSDINAFAAAVVQIFQTEVKEKFKLFNSIALND